MSQLFGKKLRFLRRNHGLTQSDLAEQLGLAAHTHIAKLEANQDVPSLALVVRVATNLHVTTDYLLRDTIPVEEPRRRNELIAHDSVEAIEGLQHFGATLRALRVRAGITQADLAQQLRLARQGYISNLETGRKTPSLDLAVQIADYFGLTTDLLFQSTLPTDTDG
jgi:transcriptional regulator with XRE-family HTH domain